MTKQAFIEPLYRKSKGISYSDDYQPGLPIGNFQYFNQPGGILTTTGSQQLLSADPGFSTYTTLSNLGTSTAYNASEFLNK